MTEVAEPPTTSEPRAFPLVRECPYRPPAEYADLRENESVSPIELRLNGKRAWLLTRFEDYRRVLSDPRISSDMRLDGFPLQIPVPVELLRMVPPALFNLDAPEHTVHRRLLIPEFTVRRVESMRPRVQALTDGYIDEMEKHGGPVDLLESIAFPLPSQAMCELIGVPFDDRDFFRDWITLVLNPQTTPEQHGVANMEMTDYLDDFLAGKEREPADDLASRLIARAKEDNSVDLDEIASLLRVLIAGGHETTATMLSLGTMVLLQNPGQLAALKADPSLTPKAIDELMRYLSVSDSGTGRVVLEDIEVGGVVIKAGEGIIAAIGAANHDPAAFENPDEFDIRRDASKQVGFGYGIHQCIGQTLARMEMEVVFNTLFARLPDLRLAVPSTELRFKDAVIRGLLELPVTW